MVKPTVTAIILAASIFLALGLIAIGVMVYSPAAEAAKESNTEFSATTTELKDTKYLLYDNTNVSGSQIINALRKHKIEGMAGNIGIHVTTGTGNSNWYYSTVTGDIVTNTKLEPTNVNDPTKPEYINPSGIFKASVKRDSNSVIRAIVFTQN